MPSKNLLHKCAVFAAFLHYQDAQRLTIYTLIFSNYDSQRGLISLNRQREGGTVLGILR